VGARRSTRHRWVADVLEKMLAEPHDGPTRPPEIFTRIIDYLMGPAEAMNEGRTALRRSDS
jgi:hypothetical protein